MPSQVRAAPPAAVRPAFSVPLHACAAVATLLVPTLPIAAAAPAPDPRQLAGTVLIADAPDAADLRALFDLLDKPAIRGWLRAQTIRQSTATPEPAERPPISWTIGNRLDAARDYLRSLAEGVADLPSQLGRVRGTLMAELRARGLLALVGPVVGFALLGALAEGLFWRTTAGLRQRLIEQPVDTVEQRLATIAWRTLYGIGVVGAFATGSVGAFLAFDWPPLLQHIVLTYLVVFLAVRMTLVLGRIVLAPGAERFRVLPMATATARYWFIWSAALVGAFYFAKGTFRLVPALGGTTTTRTIVGVLLSFVVLVLALIALRRRPAPPGGRPSEVGTWLLGAALVGIWLTAFTGETAPFDIGLVALLLALANLGLRRAVDHLVRPSETSGEQARSVAVVAFERGLRIALVISAALVVARVLDLDLIRLAATDTAAMRVARGILNVIIVGLAADLVWGVARAWIDRSVNDADVARASSTEDEQRHRQRLRTLLPILRNLLLIVLTVVAGLTALASLGVEVGPLVAGAGVVGIAVGFGAQTLVKDVISGLFFLLDDAFRVGEYIESGRIKGTVEAFSLRSVKLRHHRGPLHTVPFGTLSTITNYSRDWVIDKMTLGLAYDTDLGRVKRIVKDIGRQLKAEPEFEPHILESLKMQGVDAFGDFALQVRLKMMTRPGEQFPIRRRAYALIKKAFDQEGIRFAYPTVTVAGAGDAAVIAAAHTTADGSTPKLLASDTDEE